MFFYLIKIRILVIFCYVVKRILDRVEPHPEGGYFREVYRSEGVIPQNCLPEMYQGQRNYATSIYFLLGQNDISAFHRLRADELWYFHYGGSLNIYMINPHGELEIRKLGSNIEEDQHLQVAIPTGSIFGAKVNSTNNYTLMGCMVAPGFDFNDFELMDKSNLIDAYPQYSDTIELLTK